MKEDTALSPVSGWTVAPISAYGAVMLRLDYLTHATQTAEESQQSPNYVLHSPQARELALKILAMCDRLESGELQGAGLPKH